MSTWPWRSPDDTAPAKGFRGENFGGNHVREEMPVKRVAGMWSLWRRPALIARCYDDGHITLAEGEWRT